MSCFSCFYTFNLTTNSAVADKLRDAVL